MKAYIKKIRSKLGKELFIHPAARIIIENGDREILVIERTDNGRLGIPAGALEEGETIEECIIREVREETGLRIIGLEVIGISSNPNAETVVYPNGDRIQYFTIEFFSNNWEGEIEVEDLEEIRQAKFMDPEDAIHRLPPNEWSAFESLKHYREKQKIMLK